MAESQQCMGLSGITGSLPSPGIWRELLEAVDARRAQLEHVRDELARHPSLSDPGQPPTASDET
jgi:hypothetical protein